MTPDDITAKLARLVIPDAEADARRRRSERGDTDALVADLWRRAEVPRRHADKAENPPPITSPHPWYVARMRVFDLIGKGVTVCLSGIRGNGKTQIGVDAIRCVTRGLKPARFITAQRLFIEIRRAFRSDSTRTEAQVIDSFRKPALLVIDEIGQRGESDWENRMFFEVLNARYNDLTDTILTANLSPEAVAECLGPSILSRMQEGGGLIDCQWPSFRA